MIPANHFMKYAAVELEPNPLRTTRHHTVQTTSEGLCPVARIEETTWSYRHYLLEMHWVQEAKLRTEVTDISSWQTLLVDSVASNADVRRGTHAIHSFPKKGGACDEPKECLYWIVQILGIDLFSLRAGGGLLITFRMLSESRFCWHPEVLWHHPYTRQSLKSDYGLQFAWTEFD